MWQTKRHWITFLIYFIISLAICLALLFLVGIIAMGDDLSNDERAGMTSPAVFILRYILGFPLGLFLHFDRLYGGLPEIIIVQAFNSFIQLSIIFFIMRKTGRPKTTRDDEP